MTSAKPIAESEEETGGQRPRSDERGPRSLETLLDLMRSFGERPDRTALTRFRKEDTESWSYDELRETTARLAAGLRQRGVAPGDRVALFGSPSPEWIAVCLAAIGCGAIAVPMDSQLDQELLEHLLGDSEPKFVFTTSDLREQLGEADHESNSEVFLLDEEDSWRELLADEAEEFDTDSVDVSPDSIAVLFYTSGTTGPPKGVPLSHGNLCYQLRMLEAANLVTPDDRILLPLPLHHVYPLVIGVLLPLWLGLPILLPHGWTGPQIARAIREGRASIIIGVPRLYRAFYEGIESRLQGRAAPVSIVLQTLVGSSRFLRRRTGIDAGRWLMRPLHRQFGEQLRVLACGGSPLDPELAWKLEGLGWRVAVGYGLTETSPLLTLNPPGGSRKETVGRVIDETEVEIRPPKDDKGDEGQATDENGDEGEIVARGPGVFDGYWNLPDKTDEAFTEDGWFRTGDLGRFDDDGYLLVTGRVSTRMVTESGENLQPDELEELYGEHPAIREIGVLMDEQKLVAVVVPEKDHSPESADGDEKDAETVIREAVESKGRELRSYQRLDDFVIARNPLPRTRLGKIRRGQLEERYQEIVEAGGEEQAPQGPMPVDNMSQEDQNLLRDEAARSVWDWLCERYPDERLTPDSRIQLELGVDSMEWLNITMELSQRLGLDLNEDQIGQIETVRDLLEVAADASGDGSQFSTEELREHPEQRLSDKQKQWLEPLGRTASLTARSGYSANRAAMKTLYRLQVRNAENIPADGQFIIIANHTSHLDPFAIAATLPNDTLRETYWAAYTGAAFGNPLSRFVSRLAQSVPVDPERQVVSSLAFGAAVLKRGKNLIWFPEGERSESGELQSFQPGIGLLLSLFRVPVLPACIEGTYEALPRQRTVPRPGRITITYGDVVEADELPKADGHDEQQDVQEAIVEQLHDRLTKLSESVGSSGEPGEKDG